MRALLLAGVAVTALFWGGAALAQQAVTCVNCDTLVQQLLAYTEQGLQLNQETVTAVQEYTSALPLATTSFEDLTDDINQILGLVNTASMLINQTGQIIQNISTLGGYPLGNIPDWHQQLANEANAVGKAMMVCGEANNILQGLSNDAHLLSSFVNQVMAVLGRQQSLQTVSSQISQLGQEIQKIESGKMGCRQAFATYYAGRQDREYLITSLGDHDMQMTWVWQCQAIAALGGSLPANCAGAQ
jgi:hypothetical protein